MNSVATENIDSSVISHNDYVTSVISTIIDPKYMAEYEIWVDKINNKARQAPGFFSVDILKPNNHTQPEYVVILKFDSYQNLKNWLNSSTCKKLMAEAKQYQRQISNEQQGIGMEMWFTREDNQRYYPKPSYYKQVIMGLMVVYPLSTLIGMLLAPLIGSLSMPLQSFIIIFIMSCLMTWPVMPYLTKWLHSWLYPKPI